MTRNGTACRREEWQHAVIREMRVFSDVKETPAQIETRMTGSPVRVPASRHMRRGLAAPFPQLRRNAKGASKVLPGFADGGVSGKSRCDLRRQLSDG